MVGDTEERSLEWAKRINCAVEGLFYKGGKLLKALNKYRDASKEETSCSIESLFWRWLGCTELAGC